MPIVKDEHNYIESNSMAAFMTREAAMGRIVVPFRPPMSIDSSQIAERSNNFIL
ncbi:MAG: hypothetical protein K2G87_02555 [Oscillospiraceae bacterium]|nr:hypothetical protein [Oscillospiraceae bacterium]